MTHTQHAKPPKDLPGANPFLPVTAATIEKDVGGVLRVSIRVAGLCPTEPVVGLAMILVGVCWVGA